MLIAQRLFDEYNQTINRYVDLPDYQLNNYSNADLPSDIFEDPEGLFYMDKKNPYLWYRQAERENQFITKNKQNFSDKSKSMGKLLEAVNRKRISIGELLENTDLTTSSNLQKVYGELESVVAMYDQFYKLCADINAHLENSYGALKAQDSYPNNFNNFHQRSRTLISKARRNQPVSSNEVQGLDAQRKALEVIKIDGMETRRKQITTSTTKLVNAFADYSNQKSIPTQYELYGAHYYYHNISMLNLTNRYGNGYVAKYNETAQEKGWIKALEIPHFYKVVYPEKLDKEELAQLDDNKLLDLLEKEVKDIAPKPPIQIVETPTTKPQERAPANTSTPNAEPVPKKKQKEELPPVDYDRGIIVHSEVIYVTADSFDLELFDHLIKDGDRVSIKVNNEWKFKNISLETDPQTVTIHVKPGQQNFILVHADNTGNRPPNTIAIAYTVNGERKVINLKTDLENSQMVEIKYGG